MGSQPADEDPENCGRELRRPCNFSVSIERAPAFYMRVDCSSLVYWRRICPRRLSAAGGGVWAPTRAKSFRAAVSGARKPGLLNQGNETVVGDNGHCRPGGFDLLHLGDRKRLHGSSFRGEL